MTSGTLARLGGFALVIGAVLGIFAHVQLASGEARAHEMGIS
jgi:hypothetical protein